jgi:hypothetical protein
MYHNLTIVEEVVDVLVKKGDVDDEWTSMVIELIHHHTVVVEYQVLEYEVLYGEIEH